MQYVLLEASKDRDERRRSGPSQRNRLRPSTSYRNIVWYASLDEEESDDQETGEDDSHLDDNECTPTVPKFKQDGTTAPAKAIGAELFEQFITLSKTKAVITSKHLELIAPLFDGCNPVSVCSPQKG